MRELSDPEMQAAWFAAEAAQRVHQPMWLRTLWKERKKGGDSAAVAELVAMMRRGLNLPAIDDPKTAARCLCTVIHTIVERFERLAADGALRDGLPGLRALPLLYSPTAGNGASKWTTAARLFKETGVGRKVRRRHPGLDASPWSHLASDAVSVVQFAAAQMAKFDDLKSSAVGFRRYEYRRLRARYGVFGTFYLLRDGAVLLWPDWLEVCRGLTVPLSENVPGYQRACQAVAQEFFGDPKNEAARELLEPLLAKARRHGHTAARARMEAAQMVADAVGRLAGEK